MDSPGHLTVDCETGEETFVPFTPAEIARPLPPIPVRSDPIVNALVALASDPALSPGTVAAIRLALKGVSQ